METFDFPDRIQDLRTFSLVTGKTISLRRTTRPDAAEEVDHEEIIDLLLTIARRCLICHGRRAS